MKRVCFVLTLLLILSTNCSRTKIQILAGSPLIGTWNFSRVASDGAVYSRAEAFAQSNGYRFNSDGTMKERNISGFCGTSPLSLSDYNGTWTMVKDNIIKIERENFDSAFRTYTIKYELIGNDSLKILPMN